MSQYSEALNTWVNGLKNSRDQVGGDQYLLGANCFKKGTKKALGHGSGKHWKTDPWKVCCVRRHIDMSWHVRVSFREDPETEGPFLFVCWGLTGRWSKSSRTDMKEENLWVRHQSTSHDCNTTSTMTLPVFLKLASASERLFWSIQFDATPSKIQIYDEYGNINL